jgi:nucleoside-diphosphate-sugar epimerase
MKMLEKCRVLVTGASGFIGGALTHALAEHPAFEVVAACRMPIHGNTVEHRAHDLLDSLITPDLHDIDVVIHTAARVHVMDEQASNPIDAFRAANVKGTLVLAEAAARSGVKRFVYLSSIKVNGESTLPGCAFSASDAAAPKDDYGISKFEAEQGLQALAERTGLEVVIIRPPLVYGPGVKANFQAMMRWVHKGVPLPLGMVENKRSMVGISNLVDLIIHCITHEKAANKTFLVSDGTDVSTPELLTKVAHALGKKAFLVPVPVFLLRTGLTALGKKEIAYRLCNSLQVNIDYTCAQLNWQPKKSTSEELIRTVKELLKAEAH